MVSPIKDGVFQNVSNCNGHVGSERSEIETNSASTIASSSNGECDTTPVRHFKFSSSPSMEMLRQLTEKFVEEREWSKFHTPRNILLALVGEVGEVAELLQARDTLAVSPVYSQWKGEVEPGLPDWSEAQREALAHELSDVLIYLVRLAHACQIDLPQAALDKMALNAEKYPKDKVKGSSKKYTEYQ